MAEEGSPSRPIYRSRRDASSVERFDLRAAAARVAASSLTSSQRVVLLLGYAMVADAQGQCWPGPDFISAATGLSVRTVKTVVAELAGLGVLLRCEVQRPANQRRTAAYVICLDAIPQTPPTGTASKPTVQPLHTYDESAVQPLHTYDDPRGSGSSAKSAHQPDDETPIFRSNGAMAAPNRSIEEDLKKEEILQRSREGESDEEPERREPYQPDEQQEEEPPPEPQKLKPVDTATQTVWEAFCRTADEFYERDPKPGIRPIPRDIRTKIRERMEATRTAKGSWPAAIGAVIDMIGALHFSPECAFYQGKKDGKTYLGASTLFKNDKWTDRLDMGERWARSGREHPQEKRTDGALVARAEKAWGWIEANHPLYAVRPDDVIDRWNDPKGIAAFRSALNAVGGWTAWGQIAGPRRPAAKSNFIAAFTAAYTGAPHGE